MTEDDRRLLTALRRPLLHLHKTLLDWERASHERFHGRLSGNELLDVILNDEQFAWLRAMSQLIVRIDEALEGDEADVPVDVPAIVAHVRTLSSPDETGSLYARRYFMALQEQPEAILAHRALIKALKDSAPPRDALPHERS